MKVGYVEWPAELPARPEALAPLRQSIERAGLDLLVTNELPFGTWVASSPDFSLEVAERTVEEHQRGIALLRQWDVPAVITSRPLLHEGRLINQAVEIERGAVRPLRAKQYFPSETGWHEDAWFHGDDSSFVSFAIAGVKVGVLLCTEAMFNEHARSYGREGVALIVIPRATGIDVRQWQIAGAMAALVSGAYVVSSNRADVGMGDSSQFGGGGFAYAPGGEPLGTTDRKNWLQILDLDVARSARAQGAYPCNVPNTRPNSRHA